MLQYWQTMGQERHDMAVLAAEVTVLVGEGETAERPAALLRRYAFQVTPNGRRHKRDMAQWCFSEADAFTTAAR